MRFCIKLCIFMITSTITLFISLVTWEHIVASYLRYRSFNNPAAQHIKAMENYKNQDYPALPPPVNDAECPSHPLSNLPRPSILATEDDISPSGGRHVKGAIVYLLEFIDRPLRENHREMMKFNKGLWSLWENFSQDYPHYPVYIFHEPAFTKKYRDRYSKTWPPELKIHFQEIQFSKIPDSFTKGASLENLGLNPTNRRAFPGYNNMIRFFWKDIMDLDILVKEKLDYFWRLDHDSILQSKVGLDVFHYMMKRNLKYGYRTVTTDVRHVTNGMMAFFDKYRRDPQHQSVTNGTSCATMSQRNCLEIPDTPQERNEYFPLMYYNNFEIVHLPTWRSKNMRHLTDLVDRTDMIYWNRWGDAPLRYYSINMMLDVQKEVMEWCHIRYFHHKQFEPLCNLEPISYHYDTTIATSTLQ